MALHYQYVAHMCCTFVAQRTRVGQPVWPRVVLQSRILRILMLIFLLGRYHVCCGLYENMF